MNFLIIIFLFFCVTVNAVTTNIAASVSRTDVNSAITGLTDGDIVRIPTGIANWDSPIVLTKAISFIGYGSTNTYIICSNVSTFTYATVPTNALIRISGINWSNLDNGGSFVSISGTNIIRIDHCDVYGGVNAIYTSRKVYGVIDHCTFTNCDSAIMFKGEDSTSWDLGSLIGTTNCLTVEDNTFVYDDRIKAAPYSKPNGPGENLYHQDGSRSCVRHNYFNNKNFTGYGYWFDMHGAGGALPRGTYSSEVYSNYFDTYQVQQYIGVRGGQIIYFGNTISNTGGYAIKLKLAVEPPVTGYPQLDQVTNSFIYNNTFNGVAISSSDIYIATTDTNNIQLHREFWMEAPNSTNGYPVGVHASYTPASYPHPLNTVDVVVPPTITISYPVSGYVYSVGTYTISPSITLGSDGITNINYYTNNVLVGNVTAAPWTLNNSFYAGNYTLYAYAQTSTTNAYSTTNSFSIIIPVVNTNTPFSYRRRFKPAN